MTPGLLEPLRHAILCAQQFPDPVLHRLAVRRFLRANRRLRREPPVARMLLEEDLYRMLPSDWPLWVEAARPFRPAVSH
jgi:hypothetical protein